MSKETPSTSKLVFPNEIVNRTIGKLNTVEQISSKIHDNGLPNGFYDLRPLEEILNSNMVHCNSDIPNMEKRSSIHHNGIYAHCSFLASVEYSKTFDFFGNITMNEKIRLARHVIVACSTLHDAFFSINSLNSDCPRFPSGVRIGEKKESGNITSIFAKTFIAMFRNKLDRPEYMLLKAIALCNPAVCSLTTNGQAFLNKERRLYGYCLLHYCRLRYGTIHGASRFAELLSIVPILENQVKLLKDAQKFVTVMAAQKSGSSQIPTCSMSITPQPKQLSSTLWSSQTIFHNYFTIKVITDKDLPPQQHPTTTRLIYERSTVHCA
ncbi:unnamed protein product [Caenorhabditis brenneri]